MTKMCFWARAWAVTIVVLMMTTGISSAMPVLIGVDPPTEGTPSHEGTSPVTETLGSENRGPGPMQGTRASFPIVANTTMDNATGPGNQRKLVRDDNDTLHAVYEDANNDIWYVNSTDNGTTWNTPIDVGVSARPCYFPSLATNGSALHIAWQEEDDVFYRRSLDLGGTWDPVIAGPGREIYDGGFGIPNGNRPSVVAPDDWVYVVYEEGSSPGYAQWDREIAILRSGDAGAIFMAPVMVKSDPDNGPEDTHPSVVATDPANISIAYQSDAGGDWDIWFSNSTNYGAAWSTPVRLSDNAADSMYPSLAGVGDDLHVVWQDDTSGTFDVYYRNSTDLGANWTPNLSVEATDLSADGADSGHPSVAQWKGRVFVVWDTDLDTPTGDLYTRLYAGGQWLDAQNFTWDDEGNWRPNLKIDGAGDRFEWIWTGNLTSPFPIYYSFLSSVVTIPTLDWTGEAGFVNDGVDPDEGTTGHIYTYRVDYSDSDDDAPTQGFPQVFIDRNRDGDFDDVNEKVEMSEVNSSDTTYSDGKLYTYSTSFPDIGNYTYRFKAIESGSGIGAIGEPTQVRDGPNVTSVNERPRLDWAGIEGYGDDGVDPDSGPLGHEFEFIVKYTDLLDEAPAPGNPKLLIDMDNNSAFDDPGDLTLNMTDLASADTTYYNGKFYTVTYTFDQVGTYNHMFTTVDMTGLNNTTELRVGPVVRTVGSLPVLALTGEAGFVTDGVDPDAGVDTTVFQFMVRYLDADGDPPMENGVKVWVDLNRNGTQEADEWSNMTEANASETDFVAGKTYEHKTALPSVGAYNHSFLARDINMNLVELGPFDGPSVTGINDPPSLAWTGEAGFETDGLDPETGNTSETVFRYQVMYTDDNDDPPLAGYPNIWVDRDMDGVRDLDEWEVTDEVDVDDDTYTDGKLYNYSTTFSLGGTYNYSFSALDMNEGLATGDPIADHEGPNVTYVAPVENPPVLSWLGTGDFMDRGVTPLLGPPGTAFTYKVNYTDADGELPATGYPVVWIDLDLTGAFEAGENFTMEEEDLGDTDVTDGKVYTHTRTIDAPGIDYRYMFEAVDADGTAALNLSGTGPLVRANLAPSLEFVGTGGLVSDGIDPDTDVFGTEFTYRVRYVDPEGDAPLGGTVTVLIDMNGDGALDDPGEAVGMTEADSLDTNYLDGKDYLATHVFDQAGTYRYQFKAQDIGGLKAGGAAAGTLMGPVVLSAPPNELPVLRFAKITYYMNDGVNPMTGEKGTTFTFKVVYFDPEGDAPKATFPALLLDADGDGSFTGPDDQNLSMTSGGNVTGGIIYTVDVVLTEPGTLNYRFFVINVVNQSATLGPLEGPVVTEKKVDAPSVSAFGDLFWIIIIVIVAIICLLVGIIAGKRRKQEPTPPPADETPEEPAPESMAEEEAEEGPVEDEPLPDDKTGDVDEDIASLEGAEGGAAADLAAGAEQPAEAGEGAQPPPEEAPGGPEEEPRPDLQVKQDETEAPPEDTESETEGKDEKDIDEEIDAVLKKLEE